MAKLAKRPNPKKTRIRKRLLVVGLAIFFVVDAVLVIMALVPPAPNPVDAASSAQSEPTATPSGESKSPAPSDPPTVIDTVISTRILAARDGALAWRAETGPCGTPALPEISVDSGSTWRATSATAPTGVVSLQALSIEGAAEASMIGQNPDDCTAMFVRTFVAGDNYAEYPAGLSSVWYVDPLNRAVVHYPGGETAAPCATTIAVTMKSTSEAAVLCADNSIFVTSDNTSTWEPIGHSPGAMAIAASGEGFTVASLSDSSCAGVRLSNFSGSIPGTAPGLIQGGCAANAQSPADLRGNVALAEGSGALWLWAGDALVRSFDGGLTWE